MEGFRDVVIQINDTIYFGLTQVVYYNLLAQFQMTILCTTCITVLLILAGKLTGKQIIDMLKCIRLG